MPTQPFVALTLKNTRHVLGVLSRDADAAGGADVALLAPQALAVRAPLTLANPPAAPLAPAELDVPASLLQATKVSASTDALRRQVIGNPQFCVVGDDGTPAMLAAGAPPPTFNFAGVTAFNVTIASAAGANGVPFTVLVQEANPASGNDPFFRITEGKIAAGATNALGVQIRSAPGDNAPLDPVPAATPVHVLVAVAGTPLLLAPVTTP
jgi:hypothetical protein